MRTRVILLSGFLGAGKTTTMIRAAKVLEAKGEKVAVVTNDQGSSLIDTALSRNNGLLTEEVAGGCFCCRFDDLLRTLLTLRETQQPDVIIAEAVGSCTDLSATVIQPLKHLYHEDFDMAPLTILVDPKRLLASFSRGDSPLFSDAVHYIFEKQLEEADMIVINKLDQYAATDIKTLTAVLTDRYPDALIQPISAARGDHMDLLIQEWMTSTISGNHLLDLDYGKYAAGEAALAWLNLRGEATSSSAFPIKQWLTVFMNELEVYFILEKMAVAHLKILAEHDGGFAKASIVATGEDPVFLVEGEEEALAIRLVFNLRVETSPWRLDEVVKTALSAVNSEWKLDFHLMHHECFQPAPPEPTYRYTKKQSPPTNAG